MPSSDGIFFVAHKEQLEGEAINVRSNLTLDNVKELTTNSILMTETKNANPLYTSVQEETKTNIILRANVKKRARQ
ncbi:hypothetical protein X801_04488 [Opisthorchis viverrini]|uniref:Uncharacterized protein n=1 Tax=Opisthorchis viverrini TaxID=6198 RepID=A0A1S8WYZ7_OPIVI|nr:hypothetical protein X801_04488 [Opisthorchis viverrini]